VFLLTVPYPTVRYQNAEKIYNACMHAFDFRLFSLGRHAPGSRHKCYLSLLPFFSLWILYYTILYHSIPRKRNTVSGTLISEDNNNIAIIVIVIVIVIIVIIIVIIAINNNNNDNNTEN